MPAKVPVVDRTWFVLFMGVVASRLRVLLRDFFCQLLGLWFQCLAASALHRGVSERCHHRRPGSKVLRCCVLLLPVFIKQTYHTIIRILIAIICTVTTSTITTITINYYYYYYKLSLYDCYCK